MLLRVADKAATLEQPSTSPPVIRKYASKGKRLFPRKAAL